MFLSIAYLNFWKNFNMYVNIFCEKKEETNRWKIKTQFTKVRYEDMFKNLTESKIGKSVHSRREEKANKENM